MAISIVDRTSGVTEEFVERARRRLQFALSRFASKTGPVVIVLEDVNGPRGGRDKLCRIRVKLRGGGDIVVSHQDSSLVACLSKAAARVTRAVDRAIQRRNRFDRRLSQVLHEPPPA